MDQRGYQLRVLVPNPATPDVDAPAGLCPDGGVPVSRVDAKQALFSGDVRRSRAIVHEARRIEESFSPDLIHLSTGLSPSSLLLFLMTHGPDRPAVLVTVHGQWPDHVPVAGSPLERVLETATGVTCFSRATLEWTIAQCPTLRSRSSLIRHALPAPSGTEDDGSGRSSREIAFVGRLSSEKGADLALRALSLLRGRYPDLHLTLAGDGPDRPALIALAHALDLADAVTFAGWLAPEQVRALMRRSTLLLVPSRRESFGLSAAEAAQESCPVVATAVGGLPEVCLDGETGLLCPPEDPGALAEAAARLLAEPALARRLGRTARERSAADLGWSEHLDAFEQLSLRLMQSSSAAESRVPQ
jgi:glycosyltransferase involved in cell wall biosynthesis